MNKLLEIAILLVNPSKAAPSARQLSFTARKRGYIRRSVQRPIDRLRRVK